MFLTELTKDFTIGSREATRVDAIREVTREFIEADRTTGLASLPLPRPYVVSQ
jgi:hypothetical protein